MVTTATRHFTAQRLKFDTDGYLVVRGLFSADIQLLTDTFMAMHARGPVEGYFNPKTEAKAKGDPLKMYPRVMHPHRFDETARRYLLDHRLEAILADLFGEEPLAAQTMLYFKPPGARGQALHQDNFYLKVEPGT